MPRKITFRERFQYWQDNLFSRGTAALIGALFVLSFLIIAVGAAAVVLGGDLTSPPGGERLSLGEAMWEALMRTLDAGTMGGDEGWGFRLVMLFVTIGGVFVISSLIGVLSAGVEDRLAQLRKGRSRVLESNHTVILGWSEQVFTILSELAIANQNQKRSCIVVMGSEDKVVMEEEIAAKVADLGSTRLVCRSGSPMEMSDLRIANLNQAKAIIVVSPNTSEADAEVIKTVLAITNHPDRRPEKYNIVAEIHDIKNMDAARVVGKDEVEWVLVGDLIARIIAQTSRQSGLSVVYTELLDFGGDEIYFTRQPSLTGKTYGEVLNAFEKNAVLGLQRPGQLARLNPPMETVLTAEDELIVIAEDDDKIALDGRAQPDTSRILQTPHSPQAPEHNLILGWNWRGRSILTELDAYVAPGSVVHVVADREDFSDLEWLHEQMHNQKIIFRSGDTTDRRVLESLGLDQVQHIILLCYSDTLEPQQADARTLISLLHLRDLADRQGYTYSIVSEMLDIRNRNLADVTRADDFIVSDKLVSLMLAQVSENANLNAVFADIFDPEGAEIYLKPASDYVAAGQGVQFATLVESARQRGETAIGYRLAAQSKDASQMYGVHLNPAKSQMVTLTAADRLIVLAES